MAVQRRAQGKEVAALGDIGWDAIDGLHLIVASLARGDVAFQLLQLWDREVVVP